MIEDSILKDVYEYQLNNKNMPDLVIGKETTKQIFPENQYNTFAYMLFCIGCTKFRVGKFNYGYKIA